MSSPLLFSPLALRGLELKNRVVVAPMHQYAGVNGFTTDWHLMNVGRFAAGGAGLVFVESTKVHRGGCGTVGDLGLWHDRFVPGMQRMVSLAHDCGAAIGVQLGHSGRKSRIARPWEGGRALERTPEMAALVPDWDDWELVAPSALPADARSPVPRALERHEIAALVEAWASAARRADEAGFDTIEIHGAHGFLIHQFLSPEANQRTDAYGGSEANRFRFALEVAEATRAAWPAAKPLFMRLSIEDDAGWTADASARLARELAARGVDVIDCSAGGMRAGSPVPPDYGYQVPYAEKLRRESDVRTMAVGLIVHAEQAERILREGRADLVALAREILYNPNWPMDAARKLGLNGFDLVPPAGGWWLGKRADAVPSIAPSTYPFRSDQRTRPT
ncbi:MAG: NADH:flavin oxidoreductase/NADH oxidase [Burkholderiaceae bacterium]